MNGPIRQTVTPENFWDRLDRSGECWLWTRSKDGNGYGKVWYEGKLWNAHRLAWVLTNGPIPEGRWFVCHRCDTPACCRPEHLFLGTDQDNVRDMWEKRRRDPSSASSPGSRNGNAVLTEGQVAAIRVCFATGRVRQKELAYIFGVKESTIRVITSPKAHQSRWKHVI